jgi:hypothetical protein
LVSRASMAAVLAQLSIMIRTPSLERCIPAQGRSRRRAGIGQPGWLEQCEHEAMGTCQQD